MIKKKTPSRFAFAAVAFMATPVVPSVAQAPMIDPVTHCAMDEDFVIGFYQGINKVHADYGARNLYDFDVSGHSFSNTFNCGVKAADLCMDVMKDYIARKPGMTFGQIEFALNDRGAYCANERSQEFQLVLR